MEFHVLGPLVLTDQGTVVDLGPPRIRLVCAILLVRPGELVAIDRFVDELWPDKPPADARALVRGYVSRLRCALRLVPSGVSRVVTRKPGYALRVEDHELDVRRFERLLADARAAEPGRGVELFAEAESLWRGEPFADVPRTVSIAAAVTSLVERRLTMREESFDAALAVGVSSAVVTGLTDFVAAHPLRERPAGQLMLALYRTGRQAEALEQYQRTRRSLGEDVGVDPSVELRRLHQRILDADPTLNAATISHGGFAASHGQAVITTARTPHQLPRDLPTFVDRRRELSQMSVLLEIDDESTAGRVIVLHGAPGVGKSALAVRAAHLCASRFPDGQLHVNLRGATRAVRPLSAIEALHQLLRGLNVAGAEIPTDADEAAALFRTVVTGRRLLVVLDNAATAAQVRPLLPGCAVLVTSRTRLTALDGATHLHIPPLSPETATMMLDGLISDVRPATEPDATRRLAELCGHLPLGLHVAAARLNARPSWTVGDMVDRLADERHRLSELASGDIALRSSLAVSHSALHDSANPLDRNAARALCLFGLIPTTSLDLDLAAAVLDTSPAETDRTVERLLDAHLVEETTAGRFHMHDLTRLFAHEQGILSIPLDEQHSAFTRLLSHYLATTCVANTLVYPHRAHHPTPHVRTPPKELISRDDAQRWLDDQHRTMLTAVRQACLGPDDQAGLGIGLALALHWHLHSGATDLHDTISVQEGVVSAAQRIGDRRSLAYAHGNLAVNLRHIGELDKACAHSSAELAICRELGDRFGEQRALGNLGHTHLARHRPNQAIDYLEQQLELARDIDAPLGQAFALVNLGKAHHELGRSEEAIDMIKKGLAWYETTGDHFRQCDVHEVLARVHIDLGHYDQAITLIARGLDHARQINYRFGEIWALTIFAQAHRLAGNTKKARYYAEQAVTASASLDGTEARTGALTEYARLPTV